MGTLSRLPLSCAIGARAAKAKLCESTIVMGPWRDGFAARGRQQPQQQLQPRQALPLLQPQQPRPQLQPQQLRPQPQQPPPPQLQPLHLLVPHVPASLVALSTSLSTKAVVCSAQELHPHVT